jgi:dolichol-phosphate mannosyltransferase
MQPVDKETRRRRIVVICPVHNEEDNVRHFLGRLEKAAASLDGSRYEWRLLFSNNRSTDATLARIKEAARENDRVSYMTLSRNFGYQLSVLAGLSMAGDADLYMICDADCEDPPEMLPLFVEAMEQGADLAYGIRTNRQDTWIMGRFRSAFYFLLRKLGDYKITPHMAEFSMFNRPVRDALISGDNSFPFLRAEVGYVGFSVRGLPYRRESRRHGASHYSFMGNARFAVAGLLSSTTFPLRAALYTLPFVLLADAALCLLYLSGIASFQPVAVLLLCLNSVYCATVAAFQSIYLARTYQNGLNRRRFIVDGALSDLSRLSA